VNPVARRELLLAASRAAACALLLGLGLRLGTGHVPASGLYVALLAAPASLLEGWLLRRPDPGRLGAAARLVVVSLLAFASVLLAHAQAVYLGAAFGGGVAAGQQAVADALAELTTRPSPLPEYWIPPMIFVAYLAGGTSVAVSSAAQAAPLGRQCGSRALGWLLAIGGGLLVAALVARSSLQLVDMTGAVLRPDDLGLVIALGLVALMLLVGVVPVWLATASLLPREAHGLPPVSPAA
jgi:hypothetical protein